MCAMTGVGADFFAQPGERLRAPRRDLIATGKEISNIEQGISNRRSEALRNSKFLVRHFAVQMNFFGLRTATRVKLTENVKLLLLQRQSRWISQRNEDRVGQN